MALMVAFTLGLASGVALADTTDREYVGPAARDDDSHQTAWRTLIDSQETAERAGGGLFRRSGCKAADFNKPECQVERDNDSGGGGGEGH